MTEDLFIPYRIHSPQHIEEPHDEEDAFILRNDFDFEDLVINKTKTERFTLEDLYLFAENRILFVTPDTAICASRDTPSYHKYSIDVIFGFSNKRIQKILHVSGVNAQVTSPALNFLLRLLLESGGNDEISNDEMKTKNSIGLILKCFPTSPRQQLGSLDLSSPPRNLGLKRKISSLNGTPYSMCPRNTIDIDIRFLSLKNEHCNFLFNGGNSLFSSVKLSQCEIDSWTINNQEGKDRIDEEQKPLSGTASFDKDRPKLPQKLVVSCTQHEFRKFAEGKLFMSDKVSIKDLHLILHFMSTDSDVDHLTFIIQNSLSLRSLRIELLNLEEKTWKRMLKSLHKNHTLERLHLSYTENFADSFRRLAPKERWSRTNDVLELLRINKTLQEVHWPKFQQDETLMSDVERLLMENKETSYSSSTNAN